MTVTRGKEHVFLGMNIRYTDKGTAVITMKEYLKETIRESGMKSRARQHHRRDKNLFDVDGKAKLLDKREAEVFHSVVAKLLYVSTQQGWTYYSRSVSCAQGFQKAPRKTVKSSNVCWNTYMEVWTLSTL
jgi:YHS domain-containing protein